MTSTLNTNAAAIWGGRNRIDTPSLNTWDTVYESYPALRYDTRVDDFREAQKRPPFYIKQIYIQNNSIGETNNKVFSMRIYNSAITTATFNGEVPSFVSVPAEMTLCDNLTLSDGERVALLGSESPLKLNNLQDIIQFQSHTSLDGFVISIWLEQWSQYYDEKDTIEAVSHEPEVVHGAGETSASINSISMKVGRVLSGTPNKAKGNTE